MGWGKRLKKSFSKVAGKVSGFGGKFGNFASRSAAAAQILAKQAGQKVQDVAKNVGTKVQDVAKNVGQQAQGMAMNTLAQSPIGKLIPFGGSGGDGGFEDGSRVAAARNMLRRRQAGAGQISYMTNELT